MIETAELDLAAEQSAARARTDELFKCIHPEAFYERPLPDRHRMIFYLGHLEAFDWNHLARRALDVPSFNPHFDRLFEAGIDPEPGQAPRDTPNDWPSLGAVMAYNCRVRNEIDKLWQEAPLDRRQMVIEHRLMHAETFCYILHQLAPDKKRGPAGRPPGDPDLRFSTEMIRIPAGPAQLGQTEGQFGWDNEFPAYEVFVPRFRISRHKVTNGEYLRFVEDGGAPAPFWRRSGRQWRLQKVFGSVSLPLDWPVYVTQQQAAAYARWAGKSLPTEAQWHRAAYGDQRTRYPWGETEPGPEHGNFDFQNWDPIPVTATPEGDSPFGVSQLMGNGWEWTCSVFEGFHGFQPSTYYPGYSANFFDGKHIVLKGGSPRTGRMLLRPSFRNWFRTSYPYVYAGFRCVEN